MTLTDRIVTEISSNPRRTTEFQYLGLAYGGHDHDNSAIIKVIEQEYQEEHKKPLKPGTVDQVVQELFWESKKQETLIHAEKGDMAFISDLQVRFHKFYQASLPDTTKFNEMNRLEQTFSRVSSWFASPDVYDIGLLELYAEFVKEGKHIDEFDTITLALMPLYETESHYKVRQKAVESRNDVLVGKVDDLRKKLPTYELDWNLDHVRAAESLANRVYMP